MDFEVCVGVCILFVFDGFDLCVQFGDCIGLVGCNGVGKIIMLCILVGEVEFYVGLVICVGEIGYLLQDFKVGDFDVLVCDWVLFVCGLDVLFIDLEKQQVLMVEVVDEDECDCVICCYGQFEE